MSIHIFELPKVNDELIPNDDKQMWMQLLKADTKERLDRIKKTTHNPAIQKAVDVILELNADEVFQEQIWDREKAIKDYNHDMTVARLEGKIDLLKQLVENGTLTISQAAEQINMPIDEFLLKTGLKL